MKYFVWDESSSSRETATEIESRSARDAAEEYAERQWTPEAGETFEVIVLRDGDEKPLLFCVDVDFEPSFCAMEIGPAAVGVQQP